MRKNCAGSAERNGLDFEITGRALLKYAVPTILSNLFMNLYGMVDSLFISNVIGTDGLSAMNIVWPFVMVVMAVGVMVATGGSALVARQLGMDEDARARRTFTFLTWFSLAACAVLCLIAFAARRPLIYFMGADDLLYPLCEAYANVLFLCMPAAMVGILFQSFFIVAGRPRLGFAFSVIGGALNIALDYLLIAVFRLGMAGAAAATATGYIFQSVAGAIYFLLKRDGTIFFVPAGWDGRALAKTVSNGLSEMVTSLASSVVAVAMNVILMKLAGSDAVAAAAIIITMQCLLSSIFMGYNQGCAPVISFNYGRGDSARLRRCFRVMLRTLAALCVAACALSLLLARPIALIYASGSETVLALAVAGIRIFSPAFLLMGFNMFGSSFFTALNDGATSAKISLLRTFVFLILPLLVLPIFFGVTGVWLSMPLAEVFSIFAVIYYLRTKRRVYQYA